MPGSSGAVRLPVSDSDSRARSSPKPRMTAVLSVEMTRVGWVIIGAVEDMHRAQIARHVAESNRERAKD